MTSDTTQGKTDQAKEEGKHLTDEFREKGADIGRQAKEEAGRMGEEVRSQARSQADEQAHKAAGALRSAAGQLQSMAEGTSEDGMMVDFARNGADRISELADHLDQDGIQGLMDDVENFARQRPGLFIAAGVGLGMLLGRTIKAGGAVMQEESHPDRRQVYDIRDEAMGGIDPAPSTHPVPEPAGTQVTSGIRETGRQV